MPDQMQNYTQIAESLQANSRSDLSSVLAFSLRRTLTTHSPIDLRTFRKAVQFRKLTHRKPLPLQPFSLRTSVTEPHTLPFSSLSLFSPSIPSRSTTPVTPIAYTTDKTIRLLRKWRARYAVENKAKAEARAKALETKRQNRAKQQAQSERRLRGCWRRLNEFDRARLYAQTILDTGRGCAFTLNVSPALLRDAEKAQGGVLDYLRRRVTRYLTTALGESPTLLCALDVTSTGRMHLHGLLECDREQAQLVLEALRRAGGTWASKRGQEHQVQLDAASWSISENNLLDRDKPITLGWTDYSTRHSQKLKIQTNHSTVYASPDVKAAAQAAHKAIKTSSTPP